MSNLFSMYMMSVEIALSIYELAKEHGKQAGEDCTEEFKEIYKKDPTKFTFLGNTDQDKDMFLGNMREEGYNIHTLEELERQKKKEEDNNG